MRYFTKHGESVVYFLGFRYFAGLGLYLVLNIRRCALMYYRPFALLFNGLCQEGSEWHTT